MADKGPNLEQLAAMQAAKGNAPKGPAKEQRSLVDALKGAEEKSIDIIKSIDGVTGDFVRAFPASYVGASMIPYVIVNPVMGLTLMALGAGTTKIATNIAYNLLTDIPVKLYNTVRHPIDTVKGIFNFFVNPIQKIKMVFGAPKALFDYLTKPRNENKYAKIAGNLLGSGLALSYIAPGMFDGIGKAANYVGAPVGEGISTFGDKAKHALSAIVNATSAAKDAAVNSYAL